MKLVEALDYRKKLEKKIQSLECEIRKNRVVRENSGSAFPIDSQLREYDKAVEDLHALIIVINNTNGQPISGQKAVTTLTDKIACRASLRLRCKIYSQHGDRHQKNISEGLLEDESAELTKTFRHTMRDYRLIREEINAIVSNTDLIDPESRFS